MIFIYSFLIYATTISIALMHSGEAFERFKKRILREVEKIKAEILRRYRLQYKIFAHGAYFYHGK